MFVIGLVLCLFVLHFVCRTWYKGVIWSFRIDNFLTWFNEKSAEMIAKNANFSFVTNHWVIVWWTVCFKLVLRGDQTFRNGSSRKPWPFEQVSNAKRTVSQANHQAGSTVLICVAGRKRNLGLFFVGQHRTNNQGASVSRKIHLLVHKIVFRIAMTNNKTFMWALIISFTEKRWWREYRNRGLLHVKIFSKQSEIFKSLFRDYWRRKRPDLANTSAKDGIAGGTWVENGCYRLYPGDERRTNKSCDIPVGEVTFKRICSAIQETKDSAIQSPHEWTTTVERQEFYRTLAITAINLECAAHCENVLILVYATAAVVDTGVIPEWPVFSTNVDQNRGIGRSSSARGKLVTCH